MLDGQPARGRLTRGVGRVIRESSGCALAEPGDGRTALQPPIVTRGVPETGAAVLAIAATSVTPAARIRQS